MQTHQNIQMASGSTAGYSHRLKGIGCQDGWYSLVTSDCSVGVATDGCSSGKHSEVGALVGARWLCEIIADEAKERDVANFRWHRVQQHLLAEINVLARSMGGNFREVVEEFFLFTINGVLLDDRLATFFALGDGFIRVNDSVLPIQKFAGNAPPYLSYALLEGSVDVDQELIRLSVVEQVPLEELRRFMIGTDGVADLMAVADKNVPGLDEKIGGLEQFWDEEKYFKNKAAISRRLGQFARPWPRQAPEPGLLPDDTTFIIGRNLNPDSKSEAIPDTEAQVDAADMAQEVTCKPST